MKLIRAVDLTLHDVHSIRRSVYHIFSKIVLIISEKFNKSTDTYNIK